MKGRNQDFQVLSQNADGTIIQSPDRHFPGVLIQGDSLNILFDHLMMALERLDGKTDRETFLCILKQAEAVESHLRNYETVLSSHGMRLPYDRDQNRTTAKYKH